jgi:hypothetical protein
MKENGKIIKKMAKEYLNLQMASLMKKYGKTVKEFLLNSVCQ